ncbi:heptaprenyl diphosphate synthase component 1 [Paenibacillus albicereus]|uniref:Heptaprenyl diphosphate synthase component 1 n=1 Tax=Paenibacillus albicereus TaxID=2726185 RepID=A0A6H2GWT6_9BACL|nr:heptaprenyl diphosphate synthase component 1 [Paenibacillus albicereus]QJC51865.1 heptaprenyl diphosphate synthase component 1 [Paenibacillus albicereus]
MTDYRIPVLAGKYTKHDMIERFADLPPFPDARARLLSCFLRHGADGEPHELHALASSLVQLGLDTHDRVDTESEERGMRQMRQRQLRVLAGDYFSSRFYQLLAGSGRIDTIRRQSEAICEANRLKTELYLLMKRGRLGAEEYLDRQSRIRGVLLHGYAALLDERLRPAWTRIVDALARLETLLAERAALADSSAFAWSWGYWHVMEHGEERDRRLLERAEAGDQRMLTEKYGLTALWADKLGERASRFGQLASDIVPATLAEEAAAIGQMLLAPVEAAAAGTAGESRRQRR